MELYNQILGSYDPRAYIINIPEHRIIFSEFYMSPHTPVFFHEYTHYFLHFHTLYSLEGQVYLFLFLSAIAKKTNVKDIFQSNLNTYLNSLEEKHPAKLTVGYLSNHFKRRAKINGDLCSKSLNRKPEDWLFSSFDLNTGNKVYLDYANEFTDIPNIIFIDRSGNTCSTSFGEDIINEGIAYIIEEYITNTLSCDIKPEPSPFYPYEILPAIFYTKDIAPFAGLVIAYLSLQYPNPGQKFIELLSKYESVLPPHESDLDNRIVDDILNIYVNEKENIINGNYYSFIKRKINELKNVLSSSGYKWLIEKWETGLRDFETSKFPNFLRPIFREPTGYFFSLDNTLKSFPPPVIADISTHKKQDGKVRVFSYGKNQTEVEKDVKSNLFFRGLKVALDLICNNYNTPCRCPVYDYCDKEKRIENICDINPVRILEKEELCEVGMGLSLLIEMN